MGGRKRRCTAIWTAPRLLRRAAGVFVAPGRGVGVGHGLWVDCEFARIRKPCNMTITEAKLNEFLGRAVGDLDAAMSTTLMLVGDRLGLYRELSKGALTSVELAQRTNTSERYIREWLGNQGAGGYVQFDAESNKWMLSPEQALCLADPHGPVDMPGAYNIVEATFHALERTLENFRTGKGMEWGEHHACLFHGTERFFRAGYNANLIASWLPALDGAPVWAPRR